MRILVLALATVLTPTSSALAFPFQKPISEQRLAELRGGFKLPGGLDVNLAVTTESRIDNQPVLRSVFVLGASGTSLTLQGRDASGLLSPLSLGVGQSARSADGAITLLRQADSTRLMLDGEQTDITHLVGGALGSLVSNTADNRSVDVVTTVDFDISNASPELLGSSLLRAQDLALGATAQLTR